MNTDASTDSTKNPLADFEKLRTQISTEWNVPEEIAAVVLLTAVGTAIGSSCTVRSWDGSHHHAGMHFLIRSENPRFLNMQIRILYGVLNTFCSQFIEEADLLRRVHPISATGDGSKELGELDLMLGKGMASTYREHAESLEQKSLKQELEQQRGNLRKAARNNHIRNTPIVFLENPDLLQLCESLPYAHRGALGVIAEVQGLLEGRAANFKRQCAALSVILESSALSLPQLSPSRSLRSSHVNLMLLEDFHSPCSRVLEIPDFFTTFWQLGSDREIKVATGDNRLAISKMLQVMLDRVLSIRIADDSRLFSMNPAMDTLQAMALLIQREENATRSKILELGFPKLCLLLHCASTAHADPVIPDATVRAAYQLLEQLLQNHFSESARCKPLAKADVQFQKKRAVMIDKIRKHPGMTQRELLRRYHSQSSDDLEPVLNSLLCVGVVEFVENRLFAQTMPE